MSRRTKVFMAYVWPLVVVALFFILYGFIAKPVNHAALLVGVCLMLLITLTAGIAALISAEHDVHKHNEEAP